MVTATVLAIWLAIVAGFTIDMVKRAKHHELSFPLVVHLHVVAFSAWLLLLAAQVWLVRTRRLALHRNLGWTAAFLLPLMLVLGPATALIQARNPYMPDSWIAWLSVNLTNVIGSVVLLAIGLAVRQNAPAHKRLMLMGTVAMTEPGFSRIWLSTLAERWGEGYLPFYFDAYIGTLALMIAVGAHDLVTRGRLHPAFIGSALWVFTNQAVATWLFYQPFWITTARHLTGHTP